MTEEVLGRVALENVRLAGFVSLHQPSDYKGDGNFKYGAHFILGMDHDALPRIITAVRAVSLDKWKDKSEPMLKALRAQDKLALHEGDTKADREGYAGNYYISGGARVADAPTIWDRANQPLAEASGKPYAGCYVDVVLDFWAQDNDYGKRVNATVVLVRFRDDGERLGGGVSAPVDPNVFAPLETGEADPFGGDTTEAPAADAVDDVLKF